MTTFYTVAMLVASPLCLAIGTVLAKALVGGMHPIAFLTVQLGASVCLLWTIVVLQGARRVSRNAIASLILLGVIIGLASICTILALRFTTASQASLIFATQPVLILALAWPMLGERPTGTLIALSVLAVAGVTAITVTGQLSLDLKMGGNFLALISTGLAALYVVWMRKLATAEEPVAALALIQTTALAIAFILLILGPAPVDPPPAPPQPVEWLAAAAAGVLQYGFGYWLYLLGLQRTKAGFAGLFLNLFPVFVISLAFIFLDEAFEPQQWFGAIAVLAAVAAMSFLLVRDQRARCQQ